MRSKRHLSCNPDSNIDHLEYRKGYELFEKGDYSRALKVFKELMEKGYSARFDKGQMGCMGGLIALGCYGGKKDLELALKFFEYGAEDGYDECGYAAALMYDYGVGTAQNPEKALELYYDCDRVLKAVERCADAYEYGINTAIDIQKTANLRFELLYHGDECFINDYMRFHREHSNLEEPSIEKWTKELESAKAEVEKTVNKWKELHPEQEQIPFPYRVFAEEYFRGSHDDTNIDVTVLAKTGEVLYRYRLEDFGHDDEIYIFCFLLAECFQTHSMECELIAKGWRYEKKSLRNIELADFEQYIRNLCDKEGVSLFEKT